MSRIEIRFGVSIVLCLCLSTSIAYLQDPTETPTATPTCKPSPTPHPIVPCPSFTCPPTWGPTYYSITSSDVNAYDCG
ncbi:MAG TPA: hypothetical protein PLV45_17330, partial [bacterium]|nr:hypothetical protein [bacterium]